MLFFPMDLVGVVWFRYKGSNFTATNLLYRIFPWGCTVHEGVEVMGFFISPIPGSDWMQLIGPKGGKFESPGVSQESTNTN